MALSLWPLSWQVWRAQLPSGSSAFGYTSGFSRGALGSLSEDLAVKKDKEEESGKHWSKAGAVMFASGGRSRHLGCPCQHHGGGPVSGGLCPKVNGPFAFMVAVSAELAQDIALERQSLLPVFPEIFQQLLRKAWSSKVNIPLSSGKKKKKLEVAVAVPAHATVFLSLALKRQRLQGPW